MDFIQNIKETAGQIIAPGVWPVGAIRHTRFPEQAYRLKILRAAAPEASVASWMFRFIGSLPNVQVILSGMSTMDQLEDNIRTFAGFRQLPGKSRFHAG